MNIIFSDIDGTLYTSDFNHKKDIHPQTTKDIKFAQDKGVEFVLTTGNAYLQYMQELAKSLNTKYSINSNGASIYDLVKGEYIFKSMIPPEKANKILQHAIENKVAVIWWDEENIFVNEFVPEKIINIIKRAVNNETGIKVSDKIIAPIFKIETYDTPENVKGFDKLEKSLDLQFAHMAPGHVEITHTGVSKGLAIKYLCNHLGVDLADTMGIGDSANDIGMFEEVGHSYAMANSPDNIKKLTDHHTAAVEQNGLGMAIVDYLYREKLDRQS